MPQSVMQRAAAVLAGVDSGDDLLSGREWRSLVWALRAEGSAELIGVCGIVTWHQTAEGEIFGMRKDRRQGRTLQIHSVLRDCCFYSIPPHA